MKQKTSCILSILSTLLLASCSDDGSVSVTPPSEEPDTPTCSDVCKQGAWECHGDGYRTCEKADSGCLEWKSASCPENSTCNAEKKKCIGSAECENTCESGEWECTEDGYRSCEMAATGCFDWKTTQCGENTQCSEEAKKCVTEDDPTGCTQCTVGERRCEGTMVAVCEEDVITGCTDWGTATSCGDGMYCDASAKDCVEGCQDECTEGDSLCDGVQIKTCVTGSEAGCTTWGASVTCGEDKHCDATSNSCVEGCQDECAEGDVQCDGTFIRHCGNYDSDTCLEFGGDDECTNNTICSVEQKGCVSNGCENDCSLGSSICFANEVQTCESVPDSACNGYVTTKTCGTNETCIETGTTADCIADCAISCTEGQFQCDNGSLMKCIIKDGCPAWETTRTCPSGTYCSADAKECINQCPTVCNVNDTRCSDGGVQTCAVQSDGCNGWNKAVACAKTQTCNNGKCEDACGSDCEPFSIVILPDTQNYTGHFDKSKGKVYDRNGNVVDGKSKTTIYHMQMNWIKNNLNKKYKDDNGVEQYYMQNLKMVVHMGDITNDNADVQWAIAKSAHEILKGAGIPFTVVNGNHDYRGEWNGTNGFKLGSRSGTKFDKYFPESYLKTLPGYGGIYAKTNTYFNFSAAGQDFMVLNLEFAPRHQTLCWANELLQKPENKNKKVIMATHGNLSHKANYCGRPTPTFVPIGSNGTEIWNNFTSRHSNLILALSGHVGDSEHKKVTGQNKNTVYQILTDYQFDLPCAKDKLASCTTTCKETNADGSCKKVNDLPTCGHKPDGGNGWLRVLTFYPKENKVKVKVFTAITNENIEYMKISDKDLRKKTFSKEDREVFFCSPEYAKTKYTNGDAWYESNPKGPEHEYEFDLDFMSKTANVYKDGGQMGFTHQTVNQNGDGDQIKSNVATNAKGNMVFVWEDDSDQTDGKDSTGKTNAHDIYGRIFKPGGCLQTANLVLNDVTEGHQSEPDVAMDANGNFVVVWTDDKGNDGSTEVWMRGFKADGTPRWKHKAVNTVSTRNQFNPRIAMAADGTFAISWTDTREAKDKPQIWVRGFNPDGSQLFAERLVTDAPEGERVKSDIFMDDSKRIAVVWQDDGDANGSYQIKMRLLNANGTNRTDVTKPVTVNSESAGQQVEPSIDGKRDGSKLIVSWTDYASNAKEYKIKARTFDANGKQADGEFDISVTAGKNQNSRVCMANNGNAVITWYNPDKRDIFRRFFIGGKPQTDKNNKDKDVVMNWPQNASGSADQKGHAYQPSVACISGTNNWAVYSYSDDWDGNNYHEIYGFSEQVK